MAGPERKSTKAAGIHMLPSSSVRLRSPRFCQVFVDSRERALQMSRVSTKSEPDERLHPHLLTGNQQHAFLYAQILGHLRCIPTVTPPAPRNRARFGCDVQKNIRMPGEPRP